MAEYIEREALIERIKLSINSWGRDCNSNAPTMVRAYQDVLHRVKNIPTADVVEVRHGYWVNIPPYRAMSGQYLKAQECSICRSYFVSDGNTPYSNHPYCCECGAKMDGKGAQNE